MIGNQVWYETGTSVNGLYEPGAGDIGIEGVTMELLDASNQLIGTQVTGPSGDYAFTSLAAGTYKVRVGSSVTYPNNAAILGAYQPTTIVAGVADNTNKAQPYNVTLATNTDSNMTADFGYTKPLGFTVVKTLNTLGEIRVGGTISFTIRITNTGTASITVLPLTDTFDSTYLEFASATITPNSGPVSGPITWNDLTGSAPNGFGVDLAPNVGFSIVITFTGIADTTSLTNPPEQTINRGTVTGAKADPDGSGPLPEQTLPTDFDEAPVKVVASTGVEIASFTGAQDGLAARLAWETASEARIAGFNVLQQTPDGQFVAANSELIFAERAGAASGARYELQVLDLAPGDTSFTLEVIRLDGTAQRFGPVVVSVAP